MAEKPKHVNPRAFVDVRWVLFAVLTPLVLAGLFVLLVKIQGLMRYDLAYFADEYAEQYDSPGEVARQLEVAVQTGDRALLAELQCLRRTVPFDTNPDIVLVMLWDSDKRYFTYMYLDMQKFERHPHYIEQVKGRWVVSPADAYYYFHSGDWLKVAVPIAIVWWLAGAVVILAIWVFRLSAKLRQEVYGR